MVFGLWLAMHGVYGLNIVGPSRWKRWFPNRVWVGARVEKVVHFPCHIVTDCSAHAQIINLFIEQCSFFRVIRIQFSSILKSAGNTITTERPIQLAIWSGVPTGWMVGFQKGRHPLVLCIYFSWVRPSGPFWLFSVVSVGFRTRLVFQPGLCMAFRLFRKRILSILFSLFLWANTAATSPLFPETHCSPVQSIGWVNYGFMCE